MSATTRLRSSAPSFARSLAKSRGLTLIELVIATAIGALLLAGLSSVARQGVVARSVGRDSNEAVQQARFALERIAAAARDTAPQTLLPAAANTSGAWFSPVYFCVNGAAALIETVNTDTTCTGTTVIAERVSSFAATLPAGAGPLDAMSAMVSVTVTGPSGGGVVTLSERLRFGGGEK